MIAALVLVPAGAGGLALVLRSDALRRVLLVAAAFAHLGLVAAAWRTAVRGPGGGWLGLDPAGVLVLGVASVLFSVAAVYAVGYLAREALAGGEGGAGKGRAWPGREALFTACLLFFLATMTLVAVSQNLGVLWVAVEATTLASAPLIFFHRHHRSLEATWKYLLICSVGIAVALLGNFFLALATAGPGSTPGSGSLVVSRLVADAAGLHVRWLRAAFVLLLVGYGTKMGLAPLHTWLPDAHAEAPSMVSALLSGALLNCAFLGILRAYQVVSAAGETRFAGGLLVDMGLFSMALAAVFIVAQPDYKRLLAYSSVEHMGILAVGVGLGGGAVFGAMLHLVNHSLAKGMLFLVAGNLLAAYRSTATARVRGAGAVLPVTGALWVAGLLAITGTPPFGPFLSELTILKGAVDGHRPVVTGLFLLFLASAFVGMARPMLAMVQAGPPEDLQPGARDRWLSVVPPALLGLAVLALGVWLPPWLGGVLHAAARMVGGG